MNDEECLAHYRLLIPSDLYFSLLEEYEKKHGHSVVDDAKACLAKIKAA